MRLFLSVCSLALLRVTHVVGDGNFFSDAPYQPLDEWTTEPGLGNAPEPLLLNFDGGQLTQDNTFDLASLPISDESNTDFWASCPPNGLGKRGDEHPSCNLPLKKEDIPTLPTLRDVQKAVGDTPNSELDEMLLRANLVDPIYQPDSRCPPMNPWHMCCICDDAFALEVCQDCFLCKSAPFDYLSRFEVARTNRNDFMTAKLSCLDGGVCVKPHIQVCCAVYGRTPVSVLRFTQ